MISLQNPGCAHPSPPSNGEVRICGTLVFLICLGSSLAAFSQTIMDNGSAKLPASIHGTVLNRVTHEPIGRALVYSPDNQFATLTDERGYFELQFSEEHEAKQEWRRDILEGGGSMQTFSGELRNSVPTVLFAKKPGFLGNNQQPNYFPPSESAIVLYLTPESLIAGHVNIPESEGELRLRLELYRREASAGKERWQRAGSFTTWADGEFRFSSLPAGTYKLLTTEELDRDPLAVTTGGQLFGYPPTYYPSANDFAAAASLQLAAGAALQANLTVTRHEYHDVKIDVANAPAGPQPINLQVYPMGHPGPGYSLGYDPSERQIRGMLPDGSYTLKAQLYGPTTMSGLLNFSVRGESLEGASLSLIPDGSLAVKVTEELSSNQNGVQEGINPSPGENGRAGVQVNLTPIDEFDSGGALAAESNQEAQDGSLTIRNVRPGQYRVQVWPNRGYVASVQSNGRDLLHELLSVGLGASLPPIEIIVRDGAAQLKVAVEIAKNTNNQDTGNGSRQVFVYALPLEGGDVPENILFVSEPESSVSMQLRPGSYRVLAFEQHQNGLDFVDQETLKKYESRGQVVDLSANQNRELRVAVSQEAETQ